MRSPLTEHYIGVESDDYCCCGLLEVTVTVAVVS